MLCGIAATLVGVIIVALSGAFDVGSGVAAFYVVAAIALRLAMTSREREQIAIALDASLREQQRIANTDELTGLHNRRAADRSLHERTGVALDGSPELAVLVLDLDHFKEINDSYGHAAGDEVLRLTARRLTAAARPGDVVARYGGEEFLVILRDAAGDGLPAIAERFRASIAGEPFDVGGDEPVIVTTSVGGASMPAHARSLTDLLRIADRALYVAKATGRNRVQIGARTEAVGIDALPERGSVLGFVQSLADYSDTSRGHAGHGRDLAGSARALADELGLSSAQRWRAGTAARVHGIGRLGAGPEPLGADPRRHADAGADMLALAPGLEDIAVVVREQDEHHDGTGSPNGIAGEEISIEARVVSVCAAWAAMRAEHSSETEAIVALRRAAGNELDPRVVDAFLRVIGRRSDGRVGNAAAAAPAR